MARRTSGFPHESRAELRRGPSTIPLSCCSSKSSVLGVENTMSKPKIAIVYYSLYARLHAQTRALSLAHATGSTLWRLPHSACAGTAMSVTWPCPRRKASKRQAASSRYVRIHTIATSIELQRSSKRLMAHALPPALSESLSPALMHSVSCRPPLMYSVSARSPMPGDPP